MENEFQNENNVIKKSVIGSVSYFEELGRMDSLKIRIDLIKDLTSSIKSPLSTCSSINSSRLISFFLIFNQTTTLSLKNQNK